MYAAQIGHVECLKVLQEAGADLGAATKVCVLQDGDTALDWARKFN